MSVTRTRRHPRRATYSGTRQALAWLISAALGVAPLAGAQEAPAGAAARGHDAPAHAPMTIDLVHAEIAGAVQAVAAATGRNFIVDPRVKGQITLQFKTPVPPEKVYLALLTQLRLAGYAVVENDGVFRVVPEADARLQTTPVGVGNSLARIPGRGDQVVTQVFELRNQSASNLLPVLRPLISPNNTINVDPGSNALVITDYADNMRRLARIIAGLDVPTGSEVDVVPLHHALASELAPTLEKLIALQGSASDSRAPQARAPSPGGLTSSSGMRAVVLPDATSNSLIVRASNGAQLMQIEQMISKLDRPAPDGNDDIHVVYLHNASAPSLAKVLEGVLSNMQGSAGGNTGSLQESSRQALGAAAAGGAGGGSYSGSSSMGSSYSGGGGGSKQGGGLGVAPDFGAPAESKSVALPQGGSVYADVAMNALIINAPPPVYRQLRKVIARLDVRRVQVYVQALIVEVDANKAAQLGVQWQSAAGSAGNNNAVIGGTNFGSGGSNIINLQAAIASGNVGTAISNGIVPPTGLNIGILHNIAGVASLGLLANFLESHDGANVLSQPNLMTLDNETAKIVVGQNLPFSTGSYTQTGSSSNPTNPFTTYERKDVGLTLQIRPQVTAGNVIKLDVFTEDSTVAPASTAAAAAAAASGLYVTNMRSIRTSVLVDSGQTLVLGGLMKDQIQSNHSKIPGLGDIPLFGLLFGSKSRSATKTDLMVFLRPIVVRDETTGSELTTTDY
ncbi:MAG: type II secretion system secretin GspD, partial [Betaproteobacteria bacterium]|nr:type II secretion system secretin GspD [Betaproteobacteria bacterium]